MLDAIDHFKSLILEDIQQREDVPFGMLFLKVNISLQAFPLSAGLTTQTNDETSMDGKSKLDPTYDEDENEDDDIPEKY